MDVALLGSLEVLDDAARPVEIPGGRVAALLVALALRCGEVVGDDALVEALWAASPPEQSANALQRQVSRLRNALGNPELVKRRGTGYVLAIDRSCVDVFRFDALASRGHDALHAGDAGRARALLDEGLALWRGDALADMTYEEFVQSEIVRLTESRLVVTEARIDADLALGRDAELITELEQLVAAHPLREHFRAQLMLALSRAGRQAEALRAYQHARDVLRDELGIEPSPELRSLEDAILQQDVSVIAREPDVADVRPTTNLRTPLTALIGRHVDMEAMSTVLATHRLVTLVGPGGVGKSRLAVEAARERFADGDAEVWLVELAAVNDGDDIVPAIMRTLDLPRGASGRADLPRLIDYLRPKHALIVLDNCEHLVTSAAHVAQDLLESCPRLHMLATSREGLAVPGEVLWAVPPLAIEDAVVLFLERGRAADPAWDIGADRDSANVLLSDICERLDGLPLAIELAAARLRAMPIRELASGLQDRFRLLTRGARTALPRQQTLRAVVDWSYDLLFEDERVVFNRLSVFRGSCSMAAARAVCADDEISGDDVAELIARLVDKSLVVLETDEFEGYVRCHMLQTLVDYGGERLEESGDAARVYAAHVRYYADFASRSASALRGIRQRGWLRAVAANLTNLRAALDVALDEQDAETAYCIAGSLGWYWSFTGRALEASRWLAEARSCAGPVSDLVRARVLAWTVFADAPGFVRWGEAGGAVQLRESNCDGCLSLEECMALSREAVELHTRAGGAEGEIAGIELALSVTFSMHRDVGRAAELLADAEWRLGAADPDDPALRAMRAYAAGRLAFVQDRYADAEAALDVAIEVFTANAIEVYSTLALHYSARLAAFRGDHRSAVTRLERACAIARSLGLAGSLNILLGDLGESLSASGDADRARAVLAQPLAWSRHLGFVRGECESLTGLALTEWRVGSAPRAEEEARGGLDSALEINHFEAASICLVILGWVAGRARNVAEARARTMEALRVAHDAHLPRAAAFALEGLAALLLLERDGGTAAELLGAASELRRAPGAAIGTAFGVGARHDTTALIAAARNHVGPTVVSDRFARGRDEVDLIVGTYATIV